MRTYDKRFIGYVVNLSNKAQDVSVEDMIQEGWIVFERCQQYYPEVEDKHFMALFKTSFNRCLCHLQRREQRRINIPIPDLVPYKHSFRSLSDEAQELLDDFSKDFKLPFHTNNPETLDRRLKENYNISLKSLQEELSQII